MTCKPLILASQASGTLPRMDLLYPLSSLRVRLGRSGGYAPMIQSMNGKLLSIAEQALIVDVPHVPRSAMIQTRMVGSISCRDQESNRLVLPMT
jgi:hypothetical protein